MNNDGKVRNRSESPRGDGNDRGESSILLHRGRWGVRRVWRAKRDGRLSNLFGYRLVVRQRELAGDLRIAADTPRMDSVQGS